MWHSSTNGDAQSRWFAPQSRLIRCHHGREVAIVEEAIPQTVGNGDPPPPECEDPTRRFDCERHERTANQKGFAGSDHPAQQETHKNLYRFRPLGGVILYSYVGFYCLP